MFLLISIFWMTTIVFRDKELILDDELLKGISLFDSISKYDFKESEEKKVSLDCESSVFLLMLGYKLSLIDDEECIGKEVNELCDYLSLDNVKKKYLESQKTFDLKNSKKIYDDNLINAKKYKKMYDEKIISREEYIFKLIIFQHESLYFNNYEQFKKFIETPTYSSRGNINILFFLVHNNDLLELFIYNSMFYKIDINKTQKISISGKIKYMNMLLYACFYSRSLDCQSIKTLLKHSGTDINLQNNVGMTPLILAVRYSNTSSTEDAVKILLENPNIDVNLKDKYGRTPLMIAVRYSNTTSTENTVKILLDHPKIDINAVNNTNRTALNIAIELSKKDPTSKIVEMIKDKGGIVETVKKRKRKKYVFINGTWTWT
jgi:hypothetical protein